MIDYVHLACDAHIHRKQLRQTRWYEAVINNSEVTYVHEHRGVRIRYYPDRKRIAIKGKILMLLHDTRVWNVDDLYGADVELFVAEINNYLNGLFTRPMLDIRWFEVKRIDYCFNVKTAHVKDYLGFLSMAFERMNRGKRVNFTREKNLEGSVYVKTKSDYDENERRNYVLNFYDKTDRLLKQQADGTRIKPEDFEAAKDVLRLEVQCGYQLIKQLCERLNIVNLFGCLFDYGVAVVAEEQVYCRVFGCGWEQDFYSYDAVKQLIPARSNAAKSTLYSAATNHSIRGEKYARGRRIIKEAGIYPFCFLPRECGIERLENPLKLIRRKLEAIDTVA